MEQIVQVGTESTFLQGLQVGSADLRPSSNQNAVTGNPAIENAASNAICRNVGFVLILLGECVFEYPPGTIMRANDWVLVLTA